MPRCDGRIRGVEKSLFGVEKANCETCQFLGSDGDGYGYNGTWPICDWRYEYSNLKSFPFKKEMKCWVPNFWCSRCAELIDDTEESEILALAAWNEAWCDAMALQEMNRC